jgi:hypothetical protein
MTTGFHHLLAREKQAELRDSAERARQVREAAPLAAEAITLRLVGETDSTALADLAGLDSASIPAEPILIAEAGGQLRAALSLRDGAIIADPFHRTVAAQQLLRARAAQLRCARPRAWRRRLLG